ncbi:GDP dissociation inhibitor [Dillenia turbinata]|uniref:Rab escort protein 1 n=1 Tax=Dillenia turbinata TaxID=194707 RepID=A0AAN8W4F8_9MAGN
MDEAANYPPIDPTSFDLILIGTGLSESVIAAAASAAGKTVLHLDPNPFYGSHFSSLPLLDFSSYLLSLSSPTTVTASDSTVDDVDYVAVDLNTLSLYSDVEITPTSDELSDLSRKFNLDLVGPRVLLCADPAVDLILKSGANQYIEFKSIDSSFVGDVNGQFSSVPDSRAAIFKDRSLGLMEKNQLMRFFKLVQENFGQNASESSENSTVKISEEDLKSPFAEFLSKMKLPQKIKSYTFALFLVAKKEPNKCGCMMILYAIAMVDHDQDELKDCKKMILTKDGLDRLALYSSSVGRFPYAFGALTYPIYGQGELPQAFCRRAAVKGCIHVLRMPVPAILVDKNDGGYRGVRLASGQDLFSHRLVLDSTLSFQFPSVSSSQNSLQESSETLNLRDVKGKVARAVCITNGSVKPDVSSFLLVTSVRVLQLGSSLSVCPPDMFVYYISALCDDANQGKKMLHAAMNALFASPNSELPEKNSSGESESTEMRLTVLWSAVYIQELTTVSTTSVCSSPMPDQTLNYKDILDATVELFHKLYPEEEFFPKSTSNENNENENNDDDMNS